MNHTGWTSQQVAEIEEARVAVRAADLVLKSMLADIDVAAPRDAASKPSAPVPANRSRQRRPSRSWPSQLNSVSRTRSGVGRKPGTEATGIQVRRH